MVMLRIMGRDWVCVRVWCRGGFKGNGSVLG